MDIPLEYAIMNRINEVTSMNIMYLKYAVEVEKTRSINKAAENLYMGQPNLSRAIKDLEESLGITIFNRTPRGITMTPQGEEFLQYAKKILKQIDEVEAIYTQGKNQKQTFSVSVPRSSYISYAFAQFAATIDPDKPAELFYKETNSSRAINNILYGDYNLGIVRYAANFDRYFQELLEEKGLVGEMITEFTYVLVMSREHPLARKQEIRFEDLSPYTEIAHADPFVPSLSMSSVRKEELPDNVSKRIFVFERASQFDLLSMTPGTFMWVSPLPDGLLEKYQLLQRVCPSNTKVYRDVLVRKKEYKLTDLDRRFITEVCQSRRQYL